MSMIGKLNQLNQVELPDEAIEAVGRPTSFDIAVDGERLVLTPSPTFDQVLEKIDTLDLDPSAVSEAIAWAPEAFVALRATCASFSTRTSSSLLSSSAMGDDTLTLICSDPDDRVFISLAQAAQALLVSGDSDLTPLRALGLIDVLSPADLVARLS